MARALVTGGAGFIGSHLVERLVAAGHEVVILDDFSLGARANLAAVEGRVTILEGSILDAPSLRASLEGITHVFHLAALVSGYDSLRHPEDYERTNVVGLLRVLEALAPAPGLHVVFASSSTVYGSRDDSPCREPDLPVPMTAYALSKLSGEHLLRMFAPIHGYTHVSLRLFNVYGPRQTPEHPYANVTCKIARDAALGRPFTLYGDGLQTRDFVYVDDVVEAFVRAGAGPTPRAVYNVGTGVETSIRDLIAAAEAHATTRLAVVEAAPWPNDVRRVRADVRALGEDLGFTPAVPVHEGIRRTVEWFGAVGAR